MSRFRRLPICLYFFTHVWLWAITEPDKRVTSWEARSGDVLISMGLVDAAGEILYSGLS